MNLPTTSPSHATSRYLCTELHDGFLIPQIGFGTYLIPPHQTGDVVEQALRAGYRHIDTAQAYGNESGVGEGIARFGLPRDQVYVTSKLDNESHLRDDILRSFDLSLKKLGLDTLDLFLIHWPLPSLYGGDFVTTWKVLLELVADGRLRSAGVSNFNADQLSRLSRESETMPVINQVESHVYFSNDETRRWCRMNNVAFAAWSPLAQGMALSHPTVVDIASELKRTPSQVVLRWLVERGDIVIPKSVDSLRMADNLRIFDFRLTVHQAARLDSLDRGEAGRLGPDPSSFDGR